LEAKELIASGILEAHVLGLANKEEQDLVKRMVEDNQELADYLVDIETDMTRYFNGTAVLPPPGLREIVHLRSRESQQKKRHVFNQKTAGDERSANKFLDIEVNDTHIKVHKYWRPAFIGVFILSKIFLITGLYYYFKTVNQDQQIEKLKTEIQQLK
jgi:hypothetical protein